ncbi:hypothetical protein CTAM01_03271, partial [Colletotrichum tamarilloi]
QVAPDPIPRKVSQKRPKGRSKRRRRRRSSRYLKAVQPYVRSTPNDSGGQNGERDVRSLAAHASTYPAALFATPTPSRPHIPRPPSHVPRPTSHTATVHRPPSTTSQRATFSSQPKNPRPRTRPKTRTAPPNSHPSSAQQILELAPPPSLHLFQIQPTPALLLPFHTRARPDGKLPIAHLTYRKTSPSNSLTSFKFELIIEPVSRSSQQNRQQKHNLTRRSPGCRLFTPPPLIIL